MVCSGLGIVAQGYLYDTSIGPWSVFYLLFLFQTFFGSANYSVVGRTWPRSGPPGCAPAAWG